MKRQQVSEYPNADTWIQTWSGVAFNLLDPRPEDIRPRDIAHHLALINRFTGATAVPYSVAEHSVRCSWIVPPDLALESLLHDAHEAYTNDVAQPMKRAQGCLCRRDEVPTRTVIEERVMRAIEARFGVRHLALSDAVKHADMVLLATEKRDLLGPEPRRWAKLPDPLPERIEPWGWEQAETRFVERFLELGGGHKA